MTIQLLEKAVEDLKAYLVAQMPAKVVALNARYADSITLEDIKTYYKGNLPQSTPESPSMALVGTNITPGDQRLAHLMLTNSITIAVFVGDDNVETRFVKLCRYSVGIVELLRTAKDSLSTYVVKLAGTITVTDPMNTQPFLQGITIPVSLAKAEDY